MSDNKHGRFGGRGYYIALVLCAAAIGIMSYVYYAGQAEPAAQTANAPASIIDMVTPATAGTTPGTVPASTATEPTTGKLATRAPVKGEVLCGYAMEVLSYNQTTRDWRVHNGIDIAAAEGTPVMAAADGTVYTVYDDETMGTTVVIRHEDGYTTKYSCLAQEIMVAAGDTVTMGQQIGCVGTTALLESALDPHVHFSVTCDNEVVDPGEFLELG